MLGPMTTAGWWGPAAFAATSIAAMRRQPGYSALRNPVSGLAARGTASARIMVPGFLAWGVSQLALGHALDRRGALRRQSLTLASAGMATIATGLLPASAPRCPMPFQDPEAEPTDVRHGLTSLAAFAGFLTLPVLSALGPTAGPLPRWHRKVSAAVALPTGAAFLATGAAAQRAPQWWGLAQRSFLALVFTWQAATSAALIASGSSPTDQRP